MDNYHLVVQHPFKGYNKGDMITDPAKVAEILTSEHEHHVVKIRAPNTPPTE